MFVVTGTSTHLIATLLRGCTRKENLPSQLDNNCYVWVVGVLSALSFFF